MKGRYSLALIAGISLIGIGNSPGDSVEMTVTVGGKARTMVIELDETAAPQTSRNFKKLCNEGFYNGVAFHRVIPNYIAQAGDPLTKDVGQKARWGTGGPGYKVPAELGQKHVRGAVATARLSDAVNPSKASSGSQFYVCLRDIPALDGEYTVFGKVTMGLEYFDQIAAVPTDENNVPVERVEIISTKVKASPADPGVPPMPKVTAADSADTGVASAAAAAAAAAPGFSDAVGSSAPAPAFETGETVAETPAAIKAASDLAAAPSDTASALGEAVENGLPPMPDLNAAASAPKPSSAPVAGGSDGGTGIPPIPELATAPTPSEPAPVPAPVSPSNGTGVPEMPELNAPFSPPATPSGFNTGAAPGFPAPAELPEHQPGTPPPAGAPAPASPLQPAAPAPRTKPKGFFGKLIYRFW